MMEGEEEIEEEEEEDGEESFPHVYFFARFMWPIKPNHTYNWVMILSMMILC